MKSTLKRLAFLTMRRIGTAATFKGQLLPFTGQKRTTQLSIRKKRLNFIELNHRSVNGHCRVFIARLHLDGEKHRR